MSKTPRSSRLKSTGIRPLGGIHFQQTPALIARKRNDPALQINQLQTTQISSIPVIQNENEITKEKQYQEKEKTLKDTIASLEKLVAQLRRELKQKTDVCHRLQITLTVQEEGFEQKIEDCRKRHDETKTELEQCKLTVENGKEQLISTTNGFESRIQSIIQDYEKRLQELQELKDKQLKEKDEKLHLLKQRMAESLGKNSQERQQQLEELKRDLVKQTQAARELQQKLRSLQVRPKECKNCSKLEEKLEEKILQLRLKQKSIDDLQSIGKKMQVQLHQQDAILEKWEERENR